MRRQLSTRLAGALALARQRHSASARQYAPPADPASISNRCSALLAMSAKAAGVPVYCVADTGKLSAGGVAELAHPAPAAAGAPRRHEEMAAAEVRAAWSAQGLAPLPDGVCVRNVYFEDTPLELVTALVTEEGKLESSRIQRQIEALTAATRQAFDIRTDD